MKRQTMLASLFTLLSFLQGCLAGNEKLPPPRKTQTPRTLFLSSQQTKYNLCDNTLNYWMDRPLLYNRSLRYNANDGIGANVISDKMFKDKCDIAAMSAIDGFMGFLGDAQHNARYGKIYQKSEFPVVPYFAPPSAGYGEGVPFEKRITPMADALTITQNSPNPIKINSKILVASYNSSSASPEVWENTLKILRDKCGDSFLQMSDLSHFGGKPIWAWVDIFYKNGQKLSPDDEEKIKQTFRDYLNVTDGIMFMCCNDFRKVDESLAVEFYKGIIVKLSVEVLNEEPYKNKLLGLGTSVGYINWFTSSTQYENGTKTLRQSFETAMSANPDFIAGFEWDEANEGDYLQPSIYNSFTIQRLCRNYMDRINGLNPVAMPGDDLSVPNLAISFRKILSLGEKIDIELLNIPDDSGRTFYEARLSLKNIKGNTVKEFPKVRIDASKLYDNTFSVASEAFADEQILMPSLKIWDNDGKEKVYESGLPHIMLNATHNYNRKCIKIPLRDILVPGKSAFSVSGTDAELSFSGNEETASAELLADNEEIYAVDPSDEYGSRDEFNMYYVEFSSSRIKRLSAVIKASGSSFKVFAADKWVGSMKCDSDSIKLKHPWILIPRGFYLQIPKKNVKDTILDIEMNGNKVKIPLDKLEKEKASAAVFKDFLWCSVAKFEKLPDMPPQLDKKQFSFKTKLSDLPANSVVAARVISKSGKMFWSKPFVVNETRNGKEKLNVYSDTEKGTVTVDIEKSRIPVIDYIFKADGGAFLTTAAGRKYFGEIGGGNGYGKFMRGNNYPKGSTESAPEWVKENEKDALRFDGKGNYVFFPRETLPQGAFTLSMEVKLLSKKDQYLIKSKPAGGPEFFDLTIKNGKLEGVYLGISKEGDKELWYKTLNMPTSLEVPVGKWCRIEVSYNLKNFVFSIDGKKSRAFASDRKSYRFMPFIFGGNGSDSSKYFEGLLSSLKIVHNAGE